MRGRLVLAVLVVLLLLLPMAAFADDGEVGNTSGGVQPLQTADIRMESETVQAVVYQRFAEYRVDFRFVNDGPARRVKLGFPFVRYDGEGQTGPEAAFRAWQDGEPLAVTTAPAANGDSVEYYVHEATFRHGVTMIAVSYLARPSTAVLGSEAPEQIPAMYTGALICGDQYEYWLHTGAGWKGTIGRALVRYSFADDLVGFGETTDAGKQDWMLTSPLGWQMPQNDVLQWDFQDLDPTEDSDIHVSYFHPYAQDGRALSAMPVIETTSSGDLELDPDHHYDAEFATDGDPSTAWAERASGSGTGEWLKVTFGSKRRVSEVRVVPGYQKRADLFAKYNRPKTLNVEFSDGTKTTLRLADEMGVQRFPVSANAQWAKVTLGDVYRGTTRDETYLSEIEFGSGAPAPRFETFQQLMRTPSDPTTPVVAAASDDAAPDDAPQVTTVSNTAPRVRTPHREPLDTRQAFATAVALILFVSATGWYVLRRPA